MNTGAGRQEASRERAPQGLLDLIEPVVFWKWKWVLVLCLVAALGAGGVYLHFATPHYEVGARVLVQLERLAPDQDRRVRPDQTFLATQAEILRSPLIVERALGTAAPQPELEGKEEFEAIASVVRSLQITPLDDTTVLKVGYRSPHPQQAVELLEALIGSYEGYTRELLGGGSSEALQLLTRREEQLRRELQQLESQHYALRNESRLVGVGKEALNVHMAQLERLGAKLTESQNRGVDLQYQLQALVQFRRPQVPADVAQSQQALDEDGGGRPAMIPPEQVIPTSFVVQPGIADAEEAELPQGLTTDAEPEKIQEQLWRAQARAGEVAQVYGPKHPQWRAVQEQIALWEQRLQDSLDSAPARLMQQLSAAQGAEQRLAELYQQEFEKVKALDAHLLKEQQLVENIQRVQAIHETTLDRLREWELASETLVDGQVVMAVRVLEGPAVSDSPIWPKKSQLLAVCAALGLAVGSALILMIDRRPSRVA